MPDERDQSVIFLVDASGCLPQPISEAEIIYAESSSSRLKADAKMIGGVIRPASMARRMLETA